MVEFYQKRFDLCAILGILGEVDIEKFKHSGVEVIYGVCEQEAKELLYPFVKWQEKKEKNNEPKNKKLLSNSQQTYIVCWDAYLNGRHFLFYKNADQPFSGGAVSSNIHYYRCRTATH